MNAPLTAVPVVISRAALLLAAGLFMVAVVELSPSVAAQTSNEPFAPENYVLTAQTGLGSTPGQLQEVTPTGQIDGLFRRQCRDPLMADPRKEAPGITRDSGRLHHTSQRHVTRSDSTDGPQPDRASTQPPQGV